MAYIGNIPAEKFTSVDIQNFSVSATANYTLDRPVANENEIELFINNVRQHPGSGKAYTASGTTLTLSEATAGTDTMYCVYQGKARQTVTPADSSVTNAMLVADSVNGSKIADDSISNEHLDITAITGQTAITSLADTDKFLVSDASDSNNLKYVEKQYLPSGTHVKLLGGTASSSVNHDFQNFMDATKYNTYLVNLHQITNGSGGNDRIGIHFLANTTVLNGSHYWGSVVGYRSGDTQAEDAYESQTTGKLGIPLIMNDGNRGNNRFYINVDTSRDFGVNVFGSNWGYNSAWGDWVFTNYTVGYNATATVTGMRLFDFDGDATVFDYEIYGILK